MRFITDECLDGRIVRALLQRHPEIVVRVQDVGLSAVDDPTILAWCAGNDRVLLTHDRQTLPGFAYARIDRGEPMPGLVVVATLVGGDVRAILRDLGVLFEAGETHDFEDQVLYVPL